jgi:Zn-dependent protease with chaperone function
MPKLITQVKKYKKNYFASVSMESVFHRAMDFRSFSREFHFSVFFFWIVISGGIYYGMYTALSVFTFNALGISLPLAAAASKKFCDDVITMSYFCFGNIFSDSIAIVIAKIIILLYTVPLFLILFNVGKKRLIAYLNTIKEFRGDKPQKYNDSINLVGLCKDIAMDIGVQTPDIAVTPLIIPKMRAEYIGFPYFKSYISMSKACFKLEDSEIEGPMAHEIFHIKHHSFKWYLLNLLSDFTLFGNGFLAVLTNSYLNELKADEFAAQWLQKRNIPLSNFINALKFLVGSADYAKKEDMSLGLGIEEEKEEKEEMSVGSHSERLKTILSRIKNNFNIVFEMYFGNHIMSYIHPSLEERIARVKAIENGS